MTVDDLIRADLRVLNAGRQYRFEHRGHRFIAMLTDETGFHTGRPRHLVACTTCDALLHEATTGALEHAKSHVRAREGR